MIEINKSLKDRDLFNERDKIIKNVLKPIFKNAWFKISWNTFRRETKDLYQRLTIQNSSWNHSESVSFYINIDSESKYLYQFTWKELPIKEPTWNFRAQEIIWWQSYRLDYNSTFEEFSKKIEEDMNLLIKKYFELSSLDLYLMYVDLFKNHNSYWLWNRLIYLLIPLLKENSLEWKKMFSNFLSEIQASSKNSEYIEKTKKIIARCIDIIDNNKKITPPGKEKHHILYVWGKLENTLKKRKFKDVFPLVINWLENNTYYEVEKEIKFILNRYASCTWTSYTNKVNLLVNDFMKNNFPHIDYVIWNEKEVIITMNDVNKLHSLSSNKNYQDFFKFSKYEIELKFNFNLKWMEKLDDNIMKKRYFNTNIELKLAEYSDSKYTINIKEVESSDINKNDIEDFMTKFSNDFPYKLSEKDFSVDTLEFDIL